MPGSDVYGMEVTLFGCGKAYIAPADLTLELGLPNEGKCVVQKLKLAHKWRHLNRYFALYVPERHDEYIAVMAELKPDAGE